MLAENTAVQYLLAAVFSDLVLDEHGPEITYTARLAAPAGLAA